MLITELVGTCKHPQHGAVLWQIQPEADALKRSNVQNSFRFLIVSSVQWLHIVHELGKCRVWTYGSSLFADWRLKDSSELTMNSTKRFVLSLLLYQSCLLVSREFLQGLRDRSFRHGSLVLSNFEALRSLWSVRLLPRRDSKGIEIPSWTLEFKKLQNFVLDRP